ncbi:GNAT family N-acetyltransferase, partial [Staphylococcus succinus]
MIRKCVMEDLEELRNIAYQTFDETFRAQNKKENIDNYLLRTFTKEKDLKEYQ